MTEDMPKMPELQGNLTPGDRQILEANNALANERLDELIQAVREHKAPYDVPCPPWCVPDSFAGFVTEQLAIQPGFVAVLLRTAVTRLAGYDTD